jgi:hemerythrin-like domain-containing protein
MAAKQPSRVYSRKNWDTVVRKMRGDQLSNHPILATLYAEHRYIGTLLRLLETQLDLLEQDEPVDGQVLYESLHYMTHYPDAFHHPREDLVYQRAGEVDPKLADSVDTLQREHDYLTELGARALEAVADWQEAGEDAAELETAARAYVDTMYRHMSAEETLVFPEIERTLSAEDWALLEQEDLLAPVPDPIFGPKVEREYRNIARKARRTLRRGAEDAALVEWIGLEAFLEGLEVLSIAGESTRNAASEHYSAASEETLELIQNALRGEGLLTLPLRCTLVGGGHYLGFLRDLGGIARDTSADLAELRRGARDRLRLVFGQATASSRN